ncbi:MAG: salicylate 1-hydroxylase alpha subunit, partial [Alphaproteobacteria bacterium]|nr:salicylate 1-hydroxylase alpha subunit [Alphaproteobacteria bacterium]
MRVSLRRIDIDATATRALAASTPTAVDYRLYSDPQIFAAEQEAIFHGPTWSYLGLEAEVPNQGDFRSTKVGTTPVVLIRGQDGALNAWVNRCAHKGATVCRSPRGHSADGTFVCVYHQWSYDSAGKLIGVPFRRGLKGVGGYPGDFDIGAHGLQTLRVESIAGMVFGSFAQDPPPLEDFLGDVMAANVRRILHRPIRVLGYARQRMAGNWKLYSENSRDAYHGGLLHLFYPTFGIYRPSQESREDVDAQGYHCMFSISRPEVDVAYESFSREANREMGGGTAELQDPRVIEYRPDMADGVSLCIQSLFPSVVLQQIQNTLATRQVVPIDAGSTDLIWTYFGYEDDDEEVTRHRLRNLNLVGPAGFISMEDGEAVEICQNGVSGSV